MLIRRKAPLCFVVTLLTTAVALAEPTRAQTVKWLEGKLTGNQIEYDLFLSWSGANDTSAHAFRSVTSCSIDETFLRLTDELVTNRTLVSSVKIPLKSLQPRLKVGPYIPAVSGSRIEPTVYTVDLRSSSDSIELQQGSKTSRVSSFSLWFSDQELAARVAKALEHLIRTSGGEDEPF
jgi:hypothetical protein